MASQAGVKEGSASENASPGAGWIDIVASLLILFNLSIAQPLLDLLGRNATYFVARSSPPSELLGLALVVTLAIPLVAAAVSGALAAVHRRAGLALHGVFLVALAALLFLQVFKRTTAGIGGPGVVWLALSIGIGAAVLWAFHTYAGLRTAMRWALPVPLLVAGMFLFASPVAKLFSPEEAAAVERIETDTDTPVVLVVFDELPIATVMNRAGDIDRHSFPNLARLARTSSWFRNAGTNARSTWISVPAILTGKLAPPDRLPVASDHPENLFSLLEGDYRVRAIEPITSLCSADSCDEEDPGPAVSGLVSDVGLIYAHIALPEDLTRSLPPINETWGGFGDAEGAEGEDETAPGEEEEEPTEVPRNWGKRYEDLDRFLRYLRAPAPDKSLYFMHSSLPHAPWRTLPTGQRYPRADEVPGRVDLHWGSDPWLLVQGYQRHYLQVQYVDTYIGRLLDTLEETDLLDRSMVIVTADHGVSFETDIDSRKLDRRNFGGVGAVPLFVKEPFQEKGKIVDRPVESIDIVPSIADVLGIEIPWAAVDGRSLFDRSRPPISERRLGIEGAKILPPLGGAKYEVVRRKYEIFDAPGGPLDPFAIGPPGTSHLVGSKVSELQVGADAPGNVQVGHLDEYADVDLRADPLPALLEGTLGGHAGADPPVIAVALNGRIAAITRTYGDVSENRPFYAMLPPSMFREGRNEVTFYLVEGAPGPVSLHRLD